MTRHLATFIAKSSLLRYHPEIKSCYFKYPHRYISHSKIYIGNSYLLHDFPNGLINKSLVGSKELGREKVSKVQTDQLVTIPSYLGLSINKDSYMKTEDKSGINENEISDINQLKIESGCYNNKLERKNRSKPPVKVAVKIISDYLALSKFKLSTWVSLNTLPGLFLSSSISPSTLLCVTLGTFLSSASAASLNHLFERKRDALMYRTRLRPVAASRIKPHQAEAFSAITGLAGIGVLGLGCSLTPSIIAAITIGLYAFIYTPLKVISPYNTHLGSISGSLPILIGCSAIGHSLLSPEPWVLFMIQTLWQFPHFYALAWLHKADYDRAGYKMFPLSDTTGVETANRCQRYLVAMIMLPLITSYYGVTSWMFMIDSLIPNLITLSYLRSFKSHPTKKNLRRFFFVQLWQLLALLVLAVYHCRSMLQQKRFRSIYDISEPPPIPTTNIMDHIYFSMIRKCTYILFEDLFNWSHPEQDRGVSEHKFHC